jgi:hypothetical protein
VIDLTDVQFLASTGLTGLIEAERSAGETGQLLHLIVGEHRFVACEVPEPGHIMLTSGDR